MSSSNWVGDNRDFSPERNNRYHVDSVGLQMGLGLPLQVLGVSLAEDINIARFNGQQRWPERHVSNEQNGILQTVDGVPIRKVYVTNISTEVQRQEMYNIFTPYGRIRNVFLGVSKLCSHKQFAFITFEDPKDAAKVLMEERFMDSRGRFIYTAAADSWHQPQEGPDGVIVWKVDRRTQATQEQENEEGDNQAMGAVGGQMQAIQEYEEGLNMLNDDCILHVFSFLSLHEIIGIERVCKRWQGLSYRMWKCLRSINFNEPPFSKTSASTATLEQYLQRCGESLTLLDLTVKNQSFNETTLAVIAKYCSNLEVLRVSNIQIGNRSLAHLGRRCPKLKEFVLDACLKFNDNDLMSLLPKCQHLTQLVFTHCDISGKSLANVQGPITILKLLNCPSLDTKHLITGLKKMSNSLQELTISACGNLRSSEVDKIVSAVPNLMSLSLNRWFPQFDPKSLIPLGQLTKLTSLNLNQNSAVNDMILGAIVEGCEHLAVVNLCAAGGGSLGVLSDRGLSMLARLRKLIELDLSYLEAANSVALKNISNRSVRLKRLICRGCPKITDEGSAQVVNMCNDLELFDLSGCDIGEETVSAALTSVKMRTNNVPLKLIVGGTNVNAVVPDKEVPLLTVDLTDLHEEHLRPDFIDDMFYPPSDSDEEDDLDHLCERIAFMFDDVLGDIFSHFDDSDDYDSVVFLGDTEFPI